MKNVKDNINKLFKVFKEVKILYFGECEKRGAIYLSKTSSHLFGWELFFFINSTGKVIPSQDLDFPEKDIPLLWESFSTEREVINLKTTRCFYDRFIGRVLLFPLFKMENLVKENIPFKFCQN